jgi:hypothetical protein
VDFLPPSCRGRQPKYDSHPVSPATPPSGSEQSFPLPVTALLPSSSDTLSAGRQSAYKAYKPALSDYKKNYDKVDPNQVMSIEGQCNTFISTIEQAMSRKQKKQWATIK